MRKIVLSLLIISFVFLTSCGHDSTKLRAFAPCDICGGSDGAPYDYTIKTPNFLDIRLTWEVESTLEFYEITYFYRPDGRPTYLDIDYNLTIKEKEIIINIDKNYEFPDIREYYVYLKFNDFDDYQYALRIREEIITEIIHQSGYTALNPKKGHCIYFHTL